MEKFASVALCIFCAAVFFACSTATPPEINLRYNENQSFDYYETIEAYQKLADYYKQASLMEMGPSDMGYPIHLFMISGDGDFDPESIKSKGKSIVLIMNGIHSGEPVGIDASIKYAMDILQDQEDMARVLKNTVIAIIPIYNVGGSLHRSAYHRMNQDGPELKGARRNARNIDLNRDFMKQDSRNAATFAQIFHFLDPDVFLDTHTTNGSDHQYTMTLIPTLYQKLPKSLGDFFKEDMVPHLYDRMNNETPWGMIPYVQTISRGNIRSGISAFNDHPFYSSGYAALFNTLPFITENLVYKPYPDRVLSTYDFTRFLVDYTSKHTEKILTLRAQAKGATTNATAYVLDWQLDRNRYSLLHFKGYETEQQVSPVTGRIINAYNYSKTWEDSIPFYSHFTPGMHVQAPRAYVIPQAWREVIERMANNNVEMHRLEKDSVMEVEVVRYEGYQTAPRPNQGRHTVSQLQSITETTYRQFYTGDVVIYLNQKANNYIVHALEPQAPASFFSWGFFSSTLEDGEWFSLYSFEPLAHEALQNDDVLRRDFEQKRSDDPTFASDPLAQLQYLFDRMPHPQVETGYNFYPIARIPR